MPNPNKGNPQGQPGTDHPQRDARKEPGQPGQPDRGNRNDPNRPGDKSRPDPNRQHDDDDMERE
jgi:hypothetical protein